MGAPLHDLRVRVFLIALEPALQLARALSLELDDVRDAAGSQYLLLLRDRGLSLEQIARRVGKSRRTIASLSKGASAMARRLENSRRLTLRRRIATLVAARPSTRAEVFDSVPSGEGDAENELNVLIAEGWLEETGDVLRVVRDWIPFDGAEDDARLSSVRHFLGAVTATLTARFFRVPPDERAIARVLTFAADADALAGRRDELCSEMAEMARDLDAEAPRSANQYSVALCVAPDITP